MKALVTGATGIVGANLVRELLAHGYSVRVLVRPGPPRRALLGLPVEVAPGDVLDPASLVAACAGMTVVFHAAARFAYGASTRAELDRVAVDGTRNLMSAAAQARVRRVVLTASSVVFGSSSQPEPRTESSPLTPEDASAYALSKVRQLRLAESAAEELGLELVAVCPTLAIGAWDYGLSQSNAILVKYLNDPLRSTWSGGCNIAAAADIAAAHRLAAERGVPGTSYLAGGENVLWRDLHAAISDVCHSYGPLVTASHTGAYLTAVWSELVTRGTETSPVLTRDEVRMMGRWYWYDDTRLRALGYRSRSLRETLAEGLRWLLRGEHLRADVRSALHHVDELRAPASSIPTVRIS